MIRKGRERDLPQLLAISKALRDETLTMRQVSMDEAKLTSIYRRAFDENDKRVCLFVYERDGLIGGGLLAAISEYYFSRELCASDLYLYVTPQYRRGLMGGMIARRLFECYRDWAREAGVREVRTGVSTGVARETAHRFYTAMGMIHLGGLYSLATDGAG